MLNRFRRLSFRLLYNECAFIYDIVSCAVSLGRWRSWQRSVMQFLPAPGAGLVLELAHGTGALQVDLRQAGYRAVGLDLSRSMGRLAQRKMTKRGIRAALIRGEAARLPIASNSIAALVSTFPTAFIFQPQSLAEIGRVLTSEGQAVILLSALLTRPGFLAMVIRRLYWLAGQSYARIPDESIHDRFRAAGLMAEARNVQTAESLAQLVILRRAPVGDQARHDYSLDFAREA